MEKPPKKIKIEINGKKFEAGYRTFKSGRKGFGLYCRIKIKDYPYRISLNIIEM